jgi:hypothetical protein
MRILVIKEIGLEPLTIDNSKLAQETGEHVYSNQMPPKGQVGNESSQGWVIMDSDKQPDFAWPDYIVTVGTVELGRHKVTANIAASADTTKQLIDFYAQWDEEQEADN